MRITKGKYPAVMNLEVRAQRMMTVCTVGEWPGKCALHDDLVIRTNLFLMLEKHDAVHVFSTYYR